MPKVSVIMPCYNVGKYVGASIESVLNSTLVDLELICIDDKSTDSTLSILKKYAQQDSRITVRALKQNSGVSVARNIGIQMATGEYIAFIDSDDTVDKDFYEKLYIAATENKADIARGELKSIDIYNRTKTSILNPQIAENKYYFLSCFTSAIYRTSMLRKHKLAFPIGVSMAEDTYFLISAIHHANRIVTVDGIFYNYIRREGSLDSDVFSSHKIDSAMLGARLLLDLVNNISDISDKDKHILIVRIANNIKYLLEKKISLADSAAICECMLYYYNNLQDKKALCDSWGHGVCRYLRNNDLNGLIRLYVTRVTRTWLLGIIPLAKTTQYNDKEFKFYLFGILPIFKICRTHKTEYFLFGIPLFKVKQG